MPSAHVCSAFQHVVKAKLCTPDDSALSPEMVYEIKRDLELRSALKAKEASSSGVLSPEGSTKGMRKRTDDVDTDDSELRERK